MIANPSSLFRTRSKAHWLVILMSLIILVSAGLLAKTMLNAKWSDLQQEVERNLLTRAQHNASAFTLWFGTVQSQIKSITESDLLRLFAFEANNMFVNNTNQQNTAAMRKVLQDFVFRSEIIAVTLANTKQTPYLTTLAQPSPLSPAMSQAASTVLETGTTQILPAYRTDDNRLLTEQVLPLYAPVYLSPTKKTIVGLVIVTYDITNTVLQTQGSEIATQNCRVLQLKQDGLHILSPLAALFEHRLQGWTVQPNKALPFAERTLPSGVQVYSLGINVPQTPWIIACDITQDAALQNYQQYRMGMLLALTAGVIVLFVFMGFLWWMLIAKRERALNAEMNQMSTTIDKQKQLWDNVSNAVLDGIVLKDTGGVIRYVNTAFSTMLASTPDELLGKNYHTVCGSKSTLPINPYTESVLQHGTSITFREEMLLNGQKQIFQVASSPYFNDQGSIRGVVSVYRNMTETLHAQERSNHITYQMLRVMMRGIETVDPYLSGQSMHTATLARLLATRMNLNETIVNTVRIAANLSQVGMMRIPVSLRSKKDTLTNEEKAALKNHVEHAKVMLEGVDFGLPVQTAIYQMHEHMDGSGYPQGLHGEAIGLDARLLSVADTFCALMRCRAYREAKSLEQTMDILRSSKYDSAIVDALAAFVQTPEGQHFIQTLLTPVAE